MLPYSRLSVFFWFMYRNVQQKTETGNCLHLLAAIDAVQSLLQLSKSVALQTLGSFLWDGGQGLPQQALGLGVGATGLVLGLWLRLDLLGQKSRRGQ